MQEEKFIIFKLVEEGKISAEEGLALMEALEKSDDEAGEATDVVVNVSGDATADVSVDVAADATVDVRIDATAESEEASAGAAAVGSADTTTDAKAGVPAGAPGPEAGSEPGGSERSSKADDGAGRGADGGAGGQADGKDWTFQFSKELGDQIRESIRLAMRHMPQMKEELKENWKVIQKDLKRSLSEVRDEMRRGVHIDLSGLKRAFSRFEGHEFVEKIEGEWDEGVTHPRLQLLTKNGSIAVRGWDEPRYQIHLRKHVRGVTDETEARSVAQGSVTVEQEGDAVEVIVHPSDRISVSIEAFLPRDKVYALSALTRNGGVVVDGLKTTDAKVGSTNGGISVKQLSAESLTVTTTNGGIVGEWVDAEKTHVSTTNGGITWEGRLEDATLSTTNGGISLRPQTPNGKAKIKAHTTNASVKAVLPGGRDLGLRVRASGAPVVTEGDARIQWTVEKGEEHFRRRVHGESANFAVAERSLSLEVETTNGRVTIVDREEETS